MHITELAGKIALGTARTEDYVNWAMALLEEDTNSENLAILAGFSVEKNPDTQEVKEYFYKSLKELGLILPAGEDCIMDYARYTCSEIVTGNILPIDGISILEKLFSQTDYEAIYSIWDELAEDIYLVSENDVTLFNTALTKENIDPFIVKVAKQFLTLIEMDLPEDFFSLTVCRKCGFIGEQKLVRADRPWLTDDLYRLIYRRGPTMKPVCEKCGAEFPPGMGDYDAREAYISSMSKT